jgi:hypothetical protein
MACLVYEDLSLFDLRSLLSASSDYSYTDDDTSITYSFNLCGYALSSCDTANPSFSYMTDSLGTCTDLSTSDLESLNTGVVDEVYDTDEDYYLINA